MTEMIVDKSKLFAKVALVMSQVRTLAKDGENTYDKYHYVTADSAFERLGAAMAGANLVALPSIIELRTDEVPAASGKMQTRSIIHGQITLADGETGATWTNDWWGEGIDRGDKSINKAVTAMMKYHLLRLFMVGTGEDADADSPDIERTTQRPQNRTNTTPTPNRTAQHRNTPQRPANPPTVQPPPLTEDVAWDDGGREAEWQDMAGEADANAAADKKASAPFVWPVGMEALELCTGLANHPDLPKRPYDMANYFAGKSVNSDGPMTDKQYQYLVSLVDKRYEGGHNAILSALCGHVVHSENKPGFDVKELLDWLIKPNENAAKVKIFDEMVEFLKADLANFELA